MKKHTLENQKLSSEADLGPRLLGSVLATSLAALLAACGGSEKQADTTYPQEPPVSAEAAPAEADPYAAEGEPVDPAAQPTEAPAQESASADGEISEEEVKRFVQAHPDVLALQNRYQQPIQQAQSQEEAQQLQQQAMQELSAVVQQHGLTLEQFNNIAEAAGRDPEVMQQIEQELGNQTPQAPGQ